METRITGGATAHTSTNKEKLANGECYEFCSSGPPHPCLFHKDLLERNWDPENLIQARSWEVSGVTSKNPPVVKGRLKEHRAYWERIGCNKTILDILREGYRIPFYSTPPKNFNKNNKSALKHEGFVTSAIQELLDTGRIVELPEPPYIVNPLSVSDNGEKLRLILDLRLVNGHVYKDKIKFDDWKIMEHFLEQGGFGFKFDISQGYHHIDIHPDFQKYLGFSWVINGVQRFFMFLVLPFGLTSAPFIFTKVVRVLIKFWRSQGIKICCFIDDGFGCNANLPQTKAHSQIVRMSLGDAGFVVNENKSIWFPTQSITWIGLTVDFKEGTLTTSLKRVESLKITINSTIATLPYTSARELAKLVGKIISTKVVLGNITQLKTRYLYHCIDSSPSWDNRISLLYKNKVTQEISFWKNNFVHLNKRFWNIHTSPEIIISSDASATGLAALLVQENQEHVAYKNFSPDEEGTSSTHREVYAILFGLASFKYLCKNNNVLWYTDSYTASKIVPKGSTIDTLHTMALAIYKICVSNNINLTVEWVPRSCITYTDQLSKVLDFDDWCTTPALFCYIDSRWGPHTIDRFADSCNTKLPRFNSKFFCPYTEQVNAFSTGWQNENNYMVPPVALIPKSLQHMQACNAKGTMVVPFWPSASFYPLIKKNATDYFEFVTEAIYLGDTTTLVCQGPNKKVYIGSEAYKSGILILRLNF